MDSPQVKWKSVRLIWEAQLAPLLSEFVPDQYSTAQIHLLRDPMGGIGHLVIT